MRVLAMILSGAFALSLSMASVQSATAPSLTPKDLITADGSCRIRFQTGNIYCVLTAIETRVQLSPDSWSSDEESRNWTDWLSGFDNSLYSNWLKDAACNGQETVSIRIADGNVSVENGTFLGDDDKAKFEASIKMALDQTLKAQPAMPQTKNKLKEIHTNLTFMRDPNTVPRYGNRQLGFAAVRDEGGNLIVYGRTDNTGRAPGIQILGDGGGSIKVIDVNAFLEKCSEIGKQK